MMLMIIKRLNGMEKSQELLKTQLLYHILYLDAKFWMLNSNQKKDEKWKERIKCAKSKNVNKRLEDAETTKNTKKMN